MMMLPENALINVQELWDSPIDHASQKGDFNAYKLPHPKVAGSEYDFSFSGLKTSVVNLVHNAEQKGIGIDKNNLSASIQHTIAEILVQKTMKASEDSGYRKIALAGGVSANSGVRSAFESECTKRGYKFYMPELSLCGDNGAMIASQGYYNYIAGITADESLNAYATMPIDNITF